MYRETGTRFSTFTKEDNRRLQVLQNQVERLTVMGSGYNRERKQFNMSTEELLKTSGRLSIHQLGAYQTVTMAKKIILSQKPIYLSAILQPLSLREASLESRINLEQFSLGISKEGFVYRGDKLYNQSPLSLKLESNIKHFKKEAKEYIRKTVALKP